MKIDIRLLVKLQFCAVVRYATRVYHYGFAVAFNWKKIQNIAQTLKVFNKPVIIFANA